MEDNTQCVMCHEFNDQMLMLTCVHDPCIECAAAYYAEQSRGKPNYYFYTCRVCNAKTQLDVSSVIELDKIGRGKKAHLPLPMYNVKAQPQQQQPAKHELYPVATRRAEQAEEGSVDLLKDLPKVRSASYAKRVRMCKEHGDEEISYYCFKCLENICPECAITGSHQGHSVKSVKKAIGDIRKQFTELIERGQKTQSIHKRNKQAHLRQIKQLADQTSRHKSLIAKQFQMLRGSLTTKQKHLIKQLQDLHQRNTALLHTQIQIIQKQNDLASQFIKSIDSILSKDEITVLDEFGKKNETFSREIEKFTYANNTKVQGLKQANVAEVKELVQRVVEEFAEFRLDFVELEEGEGEVVGGEVGVGGKGRGRVQHDREYT